jgi:hypothetical protein
MRFQIPDRLVFGCHQELFQLLVFRRSSGGIRVVGGSMIGILAHRHFGGTTVVSQASVRHWNQVPEGHPVVFALQQQTAQLQILVGTPSTRPQLAIGACRSRFHLAEYGNHTSFWNGIISSITTTRIHRGCGSIDTSTLQDFLECLDICRFGKSHGIFLNRSNGKLTERQCDQFCRGLIQFGTLVGMLVRAREYFENVNRCLARTSSWSLELVPTWRYNTPRDVALGGL